MDYSDFSKFLNDRMRERGLTAKRLSELSGISVKHIEALRHSDQDNLPPGPYVRGYVFKLAEILDFDGNLLWSEMGRPEEAHPDELPRNRFAREPSRKYFLPVAIGAILLLYIGFRAYKILGQPTVSISYPESALTTVSSEIISVSGHVSDADQIQINGEAVPVQPNGDWQKSVSLQPGLNTIEVDAKKFLGRETKLAKQVLYEPASTSTSPSQTPSPSAAAGRPL